MKRTLLALLMSACAAQPPHVAGDVSIESAPTEKTVYFVRQLHVEAFDGLTYRARVNVHEDIAAILSSLVSQNAIDVVYVEGKTDQELVADYALADSIRAYDDSIAMSAPCAHSTPSDACRFASIRAELYGRLEEVLMPSVAKILVDNVLPVRGAEDSAVVARAEEEYARAVDSSADKLLSVFADRERAAIARIGSSPYERAALVFGGAHSFVESTREWNASNPHNPLRLVTITPSRYTAYADSLGLKPE
jgi:hypothetical protein